MKRQVGKNSSNSMSSSTGETSYRGSEDRRCSSRSETGLTHKDVKNAGRSGYVYENKWRATKCTPLNAALCTKMRALRDIRDESARLFAGNGLKMRSRVRIAG